MALKHGNTDDIYCFTRGKALLILYAATVCIVPEQMNEVHCRRRRRNKHTTNKTGRPTLGASAMTMTTALSLHSSAHKESTSKYNYGIHYSPVNGEGERKSAGRGGGLLDEVDIVMLCTAAPYVYYVSNNIN